MLTTLAKKKEFFPVTLIVREKSTHSDRRKEKTLFFIYKKHASHFYFHLQRQYILEQRESDKEHKNSSSTLTHFSIHSPHIFIYSFMQLGSSAMGTIPIRCSSEYKCKKCPRLPVATGKTRWITHLCFIF